MKVSYVHIDNNNVSLTIRDLKTSTQAYFYASGPNNQHRLFSRIQISLLVVEEQVPGVTAGPGVLDAGTSTGAAVVGGTAALHVAAAHRLQGGQRAVQFSEPWSNLNPDGPHAAAEEGRGDARWETDSSPRWWGTSCSRSRCGCTCSARRTRRLCPLRERAGGGTRAGRWESGGWSPAAGRWSSDRTWTRCHRCNPEGSSAPCLGSKRPAHNQKRARLVQ